MNKITSLIAGVLIFSLASVNRSIAQTDCNCWQQRDTSFHYVPFYGSGETPPYYRNDDDYTTNIALPFHFCFWGATWDSVYINNNGNITLGAPFGSFTSDTFPQNTSTGAQVPAMIAPFWADVDTRGGAGGTDVVIYKIMPHYMIVQWDSVGYYANHRDKTNSFQVIISDGTDPIIPNGNNVEFCYREMQWTTGDASPMPLGGFNGNPANVGANEGDGIRSVQLGLFDSPSSNYYGPYPPSGADTYDGVYSLDHKSFVFDLCADKIAPLPSGISPCDTVNICQSDSIIIPFAFFSAVQGDSAWAGISPPGVPGVSIVNYPGLTDSLFVKVVASPANYGYHTLNLYSYDNATPPDTMYTSFVIAIGSLRVTVDSTADTGSCNGTAAVAVSGGILPYTYLWTGGGTTDSISNQCYGTYYCTVTDAHGCSESVSVKITNPTGITTIKTNTDQASIYPNPNNGIFTIQSPVADGQLLVEVYNVLGEKVYSQCTTTNGQLTINMSNEPNGIYYYRVSSENGGLIGKGKLIIQKQ